MNEILTQVLLAVVTAGATLLLALIKRYLNKLDLEGKDKELRDLVLAGMSVAHETIVREAKKAAEDGKLTSEEIRQAQILVGKYVRDNATPALYKVVNTWGLEKIDAVIKTHLGEFK